MTQPDPAAGSPSAARPATSPDHPDDWALAPALRARLLGAGLTAVGVVVVVAVLLGVLAGVSTTVTTVLVVLAGLAVVGLGLLLGPRRWVLRLEEDGYRVRALRSAQARSARWTDVLDFQATTTAGSRCVVLRLRDGRTTTIPVDVVEGDAEDLTRAISTRLDRGHGYRRLR